MTMKISYLELFTNDLQPLADFYSQTLELPIKLSPEKLEAQAGETTLVFVKAQPDFDGAYHLAFNIPENQIQQAKEWVLARTELLFDENKQDVFDFSNWNAHSIYFKDSAGNVLEFIARHDLKNDFDEKFESNQILNVSEIGLPSEDVMGLANELCAKLELSVFRQQPNENFTPVGDDNGLFILPIKNRIWFPNSGVPAKLLPIKIRGEANGKEWEVRGFPYEIQS